MASDAAEGPDQERHFAAIVASSDDAIVSKTLDGIVTSWNPAAERIFGYSESEMLGQPMTRIFPAERLHEENRILAMLRDRQQVRHFETVRLHKSGRSVHVSVTVSPIVDAHGKVIGASKIARDISARIEAERRIWQEANIDPLTGLANRRHLLESFTQTLAARHATGRRAALLFVDLDRFKEVNDTRGHSVGDELLRIVAGRLGSAVRDGDLVGRLGGDEFCVLMTEIDSEFDVDTVTSRLHHALSAGFDITGGTVYVSGSVGVAMFPEHGTTAEELLQRADLAMYRSKLEGRARTSRFDAAMLELATRKVEVTRQLRGAVQRQELCLHYQPIARVADGAVARFEALLRWNHPVLGEVPPDEFVPIAEETGLIFEIGDWAFAEALRQLDAWHLAGSDPQEIAINLSAAQLAAPTSYLQRWIRTLRERHGDRPPGISVEITEGMTRSQSPETTRNLELLDKAGIRIAIDDFGLGYGCLSYLGRIKIHAVKIDKSFTCDLHNPANLALFEGILAMCRKLGLQVVAEGIETERQRALLMELGCEYAQGYLVAKPGPALEAQPRA